MICTYSLNYVYLYNKYDVFYIRKEKLDAEAKAGAERFEDVSLMVKNALLGAMLEFEPHDTNVISSISTKNPKLQLLSSLHIRRAFTCWSKVPSSRVVNKL